jgi:hypothetical protein
MSETLKPAMYHEIMKRFNEIQDALTALQTPERYSSKPPKWVDLNSFKELTGMGETFARACFKNKELIRREILVKVSEPGKQGGWLLNYEKWLKWANDNAKMTLNM